MLRYSVLREAFLDVTDSPGLLVALESLMFYTFSVRVRMILRPVLCMLAIC